MPETEYRAFIRNLLLKGETDGGKIECKLYSLSLVGFIEKAKQFFFNSSGKYIFRKGIWSSV